MTWRIMGLACGVLLLAGCREEADPIDTAAAARGQALQDSCTACHALDRPRHMVGPHLVGVVGRAAGSLDDYAYSDALRDSGLTWTPETLAQFIRAPNDTVPGTKMAVGALSAQEASDIVTFLRSLD